MDAKIGRFIVNGSHEAPKLQDMLDGFIKKFVLCPECDNPETELVSLKCLHSVFRCVSVDIVTGFLQLLYSSTSKHILVCICVLWFLEQCLE